MVYILTYINFNREGSLILQPQPRFWQNTQPTEVSLLQVQSLHFTDNSQSACIICDKPEEMGQYFNTSKIHHFLLPQSSAPAAATLHEQWESRKRTPSLSPSVVIAGDCTAQKLRKQALQSEITGLNPKSVTNNLNSQIFSNQKIEMTPHSLGFCEDKRFYMPQK